MLLGSTALMAGCSPNQQPQETRRDAYSSAAACDRDWVDDVCERSGSGHYLGPRYYYSHDNGTPYVVDRNGQTRPMPSHYGAGAATTPPTSPGRTTIATASHGSSHISRGGFGGGRSSGSFGG